DADEVLMPGTLTVGNIAGIQEFQQQTVQIATDFTKDFSERKIIKSPYPPRTPEVDDYWQDTSEPEEYASWVDTLDVNETEELDEEDEFDEEDDASVVIAALFGEPTGVERVGNSLYRWDGSKWVLAANVTEEHHA